MMKPHPFWNLTESKLIFNSRLSLASRILENTFNVNANRFRVLHRPFIAKVQNFIAITKAVVALHNFLMDSNTAGGSNHCFLQASTDQDEPNGYKPGEWRRDTKNTNG